MGTLLWSGHRNRWVWPHGAVTALLIARERLLISPARRDR